MKKRMNRHHGLVNGSISFDMQGFIPMSEVLRNTASDHYCLNTATVSFSQAQIVLNESRIMKFLRNL